MMEATAAVLTVTVAAVTVLHAVGKTCAAFDLLEMDIVVVLLEDILLQVDDDVYEEDDDDVNNYDDANDAQTSHSMWWYTQMSTIPYMQDSYPR